MGKEAEEEEEEGPRREEERAREQQRHLFRMTANGRKGGGAEETENFHPFLLLRFCDDPAKPQQQKMTPAYPQRQQACFSY